MAATLPGEDPTDLRLVAIKAALEREIRAELAASSEQDEQRALDRDRAMRALCITVTLVLAVCLPLLGLVVGVAVRAFGWASGLY